MSKTVTYRIGNQYASYLIQFNYTKDTLCSQVKVFSDSTSGELLFSREVVFSLWSDVRALWIQIAAITGYSSKIAGFIIRFASLLSTSFNAKGTEDLNPRYLVLLWTRQWADEARDIDRCKVGLS
jgi:hypothetical protein